MTFILHFKASYVFGYGNLYEHNFGCKYQSSSSVVPLFPKLTEIGIRCSLNILRQSKSVA